MVANIPATVRFRKCASAVFLEINLAIHKRLPAETNDIEKWLDQDFERPAKEPLRKARTGALMSRDDWKQWIKFVAAQDVRTPPYYWEQAKRVDEQFPNLMQSTIETAIKEREQSAKTGKPAKLKSLPAEQREGLPLKIRLETGVKISSYAGQEFHLMTESSP